MGQEQLLGKVFAIMAVMMHGPDLPTEISQQNTGKRHRIFMAAAPNAMGNLKIDIDFVLESADWIEKIIYYYNNLLTTGCRPIACNVVQRRSLVLSEKYFRERKAQSCHNADYKLHLVLESTQSCLIS